MLNDFNKDLEKGKRAEQIVLNTLSNLTDDFAFADVSDIRSCFYKGDLIAYNADFRLFYIEVKNDSAIAKSGKILCEEEVYYKSADYYGKGNMKGNSDIYIVVSEEEKKMYVLDFKTLQKIYKKGEYKEIKHPQQITYAYLLDLWIAKKYGALLATIDYEERKVKKYVA